MKNINVFINTKIVLFILTYLFINISLNAQINLVINPIKPIGQKSLFDLSIINNTNYNGSATLIASLRTERGELLMTQKTTSNLSPNNITIVNSPLQNSTSNFIDYDFKYLYEQNNGLPPLNYSLCVEIYANENRAISGEGCTEFLASDFLTLMPVYPSEEDVIYEQRPFFQWMLSGSQVEFFNYNIKLAKIEDNENPNKALRRNQLLINKNDIKEIGFNYPLDGVDLEAGEKYVWQVDVMRGDNFIMKSDSWVFTVEEANQIVEVPKNLSYVDIREIDEGSQLYAVGDFKFKFIEEYSSNKLNLRLFDIKKGGEEVELPNNTFEVELGVNKYKLDLTEQVYLRHLHKYTLRITEENNHRSYSLNILYLNPDYIR